MGIPRPKRLANGRIDRSHATMASFRVTIKPEVFLDGLHPHLLVTVKTGSDKLRQAFREFCRRNGISTDMDERGVKHVPVQRHEERQVTYKADGSSVEVFVETSATFDCIGTVESLGSLLWQQFVIDWQYPINARVGQIAGGTGPEKIRSRPASIRPDSVSYVVSRVKDSDETVSRVTTTPRTKPATYADGASIERHDYRNSARSATKESDRGAWIRSVDEPARVAPASAIRQETELEVIARLMKKYPSARYAD